MFRDYMDLIDHFAQVSREPSSAGIAAVIYTDEILRTKPPREAIDYYTKLLPDVKDPAVRRAIQLRLAEHYRLANQPDEALGQLRQLMTAAPPPPPRSSAKEKAPAVGRGLPNHNSKVESISRCDAGYFFTPSNPSKTMPPRAAEGSAPASGRPSGSAPRGPECCCCKAPPRFVRLNDVFCAWAGTRFA